ncbi:MAG: hypothetical protein ACRDD8_16125 [Bacteroidales bacterium]
MRTRICKQIGKVPKEDYTFNELEEILSAMSGKYKDSATKYIFEQKAKDYNVEVKKVALIEKQDDFDYIPKIFDLVWVGVGEERNKGVVIARVNGNYADVMMCSGQLEGQEVKIRVNDLFARERGEK